MATPRLPFLWPMLFKATEAASPATRSVARRRAIHSTCRRRQNEPQSQRYGPANEPLPHLGSNRAAVPSPSSKGRDAAQTEALPKIGDKLQAEGEHEVEEDNPGKNVLSEASTKTEPITTDAPPRQPMGDPMLDASDSTPKDSQPENLKKLADKPMESILNAVTDPVTPKKDSDSNATNAPENDHPTASHDEHAPSVQPPHIEPPRYIHHFDTFSLVKRLQEGGWSDHQAVTTMKSMRLLLADNLDTAREALVSKSNVENETYLFRAACSELRTEVMTRRMAEQEKMRAERTQLQHEVDILSQKLGQEIGTTKDAVKGMFDDRKMAVRNEQRSMESKVQELNYKITVQLQSDSKSDVEGLRWVLTRRVIMTLGIMVVMVVGSLKLFSNEMHERELEEKRRANMRSSGSQTEDMGGPFFADAGPGRRSTGVGGEILVKEGDNPAFVSLG